MIAANISVIILVLINDSDTVHNTEYPSGTSRTAPLLKISQFDLTLHQISHPVTRSD